MRRATRQVYKDFIDKTLFQSTLSMRRATRRVRPVRGHMGISIHALHEESDLASRFGGTPWQWRFQSTLSMRRATVSCYGRISISGFQSTLSMRRATRRQKRSTARLPISIHALHEESDPVRNDNAVLQLISIHALHEESDLS